MENKYLKTANILYVEDEKSIQEGFAKTLTRCAKELYIGSDGKEGLELFKKYQIDIVVSDIKMPIMSGIDMAKEILEINPNIPIIFTTAHSESNMLLQAIELHVDGYLLKPVSIKKLMKKINKISKHIALERINKEQQIKIQEQNEILKSIAYFDNLTGAYNRNKFEEIFEYEVNRQKRYNSLLSLAILDIDHFKEFNDNYGHLIGDEILVMIANMVKDSIRKTDTFARWGGEEFVLIFPDTDANGAVLASNILRKKIQLLEHETAGNVTVSFGVSQYKEKDTLASLLKRCDDALYLAKEYGRNCVKSQ